LPLTKREQQHIKSLLKVNDRAAIVVTDNVLFEAERESCTHDLLKQCYIHTLLHLPTGIFYAYGVKGQLAVPGEQTAQGKL
jgi:type I restriction enzyme M protein